MASDEEIIHMIYNFIVQAATNNLKTSSYPKEYLGLKIKIGFGKGKKAKIPWIAFLKNNMAVSNGIYPAYLYFQQTNKLLLCFGVSETVSSSSKWKDQIRSSYPSVSQVIDNPERYGSSFVFRGYSIADNNITNGPDLLNDFKEIVKLYMEQNDFPMNNEKELSISSKTDNSNKTISNEFIKDIRNIGFVFSQKLIDKFIASLVTKPFVIFTGLSGSGKTMLALSFASWICESEKQICLVPVGADWTSREPLLGYPNALEPGTYIKPDNGIVDLLIEASKNENSERPYFIILDEMNLSHVERYFADFLSAMESTKAIPLHQELDSWKDEVPSKIALPDNLFIIGTVNIDETTYMFSPKVLDRANVIEFRVNDNDMAAFLRNPSKPNVHMIKSNGSAFAKEFIQLVKSITPEFSELELLNSVLFDFFCELKKIGAEFGYRSAADIFRFVSQLNLISSKNVNGWPINEIIDAAIIQKLLPKVHGSRNKLDPVLKTLASLCIKDKTSVEQFLLEPSKINFGRAENILYPQSLAKIIRMRQRAIQDGFTSFAEA